MVEIRTPRIAPTVRPAGQVSTGTASALYQAGAAVQGVADKYSAYYEQRAAEEADLVWTQFQVDWNRKFRESAKTAGDGFIGKALSEYDAMVSERMGKVPPRQVEAMKHAFAKARINVEGQAFEQEAAARAAARAARLQEALNARGMAIIENPGDFQTFIMAADGRPENERQYLFDIYARTALESNDRFIVEDFKMLLEDSDTFDPIVGMTPDQKLDLMENIDKAEAAFAREDIYRLDQDIKDASARAANDGIDDSEALIADIDASYLDEAQKEEMKAAVRDNVSFGMATHGIRGQSVSTSQRLLAAMPRETADDYQRIGIYSSALQAHQEALLEDAAGYSLQTNNRLNSYYKVATGPDATPEQRGQYVAQMDAYYDTMQIPPALRNVLPKTVAAGMALQWNTSENGVAGAEAQAFVEQWGDQSSRILQELMVAGLSADVSAQIWRYDDEILGAMIADAKSVPESEISKLYNASGKGTGTYEELFVKFYTATDDYVQAFSAGRGPAAVRHIRSMVDTAVRAYAYHVVNPSSAGGKITEDEFIAKMFSEETINTPDAMLVVPPGQNAGDIEAWAERAKSNPGTYILDRIPDEFLANVTGENEVIDRGVLAEVIKSNGIFVLNDTGDGIALMLPYDGIYNTRTGVEFTFREISAQTHLPPRLAHDRPFRGRSGQVIDVQ